MKIAITSQNRRNVTEHAGVCRKFWIYEADADSVNNKQLIELSKDQSFRGSDPHQAHPLDGVDVLITGGTGGGLVRRLAQRGIECLITEETDPDTAINTYLNGTLIQRPAIRSAGRHHTRSQANTGAKHMNNESCSGSTDMRFHGR